MRELAREKQMQIARMVLVGKSIRDIAKAVGCAKGTVQRYRDAVLAGWVIYGDSYFKPAPCECGRDAGHKGWCSVRYSKSIARQEFVKRWRRTK